MSLTSCLDNPDSAVSDFFDRTINQEKLDSFLKETNAVLSQQRRIGQRDSDYLMVGGAMTYALPWTVI